MAYPRLFVSSTCYDLQEIRFQLRNFIKDFGYDSVMSEFDDIFYSYDSHVQDSCLDEISKCQLFILVVGNNYGSFYHRDKQEKKIPDSVTLREFKKALEIKIYKHIFINKYVDYDYKNYKRALEKVTLKYFQDNNIQDDKVDEALSSIKEKFDNIYHFAHDSYKYVFYFLDIIHELKENNAICPFESFIDIKETLKKQWAGFMYEALTRKDKILTNILNPLESKIDKLEKNINKLIESKTESSDDKLTFDLSSLLRETNLENFEAIRDKVNDLLFDVRMISYENDNYFEDSMYINRITFEKILTVEMTKDWLNSLKALTQSFKWSKYIDSKMVFKGLPLYKSSSDHNHISYKTLLELYTIYNSLSPNDKEGLINTVCQELNKNYVKPILTHDDLPF